MYTIEKCSEYGFGKVDVEIVTPLMWISMRNNMIFPSTIKKLTNNSIWPFWDEIFCKASRYPVFLLF